MPKKDWHKKYDRARQRHQVVLLEDQKIYFTAPAGIIKTFGESVGSVLFDPAVFNKTFSHDDLVRARANIELMEKVPWTVWVNNENHWALIQLFKLSRCPNNTSYKEMYQMIINSFLF